MTRGRKTSLTIRLTADEHQTLLAWQRSTTMPAGQVRRARIILLLVDGVPISHSAATVGISRRFVSKWVRRFLQEGLVGLADKPGRGCGHRPRQQDRLEQPDVG
jgi:transposase